jgi:RNA polymerase sigma factor (TIGR02999 family)
MKSTIAATSGGLDARRRVVGGPGARRSFFVLGSVYQGIVMRKAVRLRSSWRPVILALMNDVTRILSAIEQGDPNAAAQLLPLVYDELRRLAARRLVQENPGHTLQATALVHEAYLRLVAGGDSSMSPERRYSDSRHFFAVAAEAMRRILIEQARRKGSQKRGGGRGRVDLGEAEVAAPEPRADLLAVDEALDRLTATDAPAAELVKLRYFAGLSLPDAAAVLNISPRSADRLWAYARAWLREDLGK